MPYDEITLTSFKIVRVSAAASAICLLTMVMATIANGTGVQDFASLLTHQTIEQYNSSLVEAAPSLRMIYPIDTLYVLSYTIMVVTMSHTSQIRSLAWLAIVAVLLNTLLDFVESNSVLANATSAVLGYPVSVSQVQFGSLISQTKFNIGLLVTLTISFLIPFHTGPSGVTRWFAHILVVAAPAALLTPTTTLIYVNMNVFLFIMIAAVYANAPKGKLEGAQTKMRTPKQRREVNQ